MERIILHCDLNNFYASVACRDNPQLRNKPVAVCGDPELRHGIVLAKNMLAKRFGVKTAETINTAKSKCPGLVIVKPDFKRYQYFSLKVRGIYARYSDLVEPFGPDEAWIDVSGSTLLFGNGKEIADRIREDVKRETGLTVSVGVSFNKVFAKLGSDLKKPDAVTVISKDNFKSVVWPLSIENLIGIGPSTKSRLNSVGIFTLGELANADKNLTKRIIGKNGEYLVDCAVGLDKSPVMHKEYKHTPKSIGRSSTGGKDLSSPDDVWKMLLLLSGEVAKELRENKLEAMGIQLHLRNSLLKVTEISKQLNAPCDTGIDLARIGMELFKSSYDFSMPLRSVGIRAINLTFSGKSYFQTYLFKNDVYSPDAERIEKQMDILNDRFGKECVKRARLL